MSVEWRLAERRDRETLRRFECTVPPPGPRRRPLPHPKPWEKDVQSAVRTLGVPVRGRDGTCLLGFESGEPVAIALWCRIEQDADLSFKIRLLAVSTAVRGQGVAVARECLEQVLARIVGELDAGEPAVVYGLVDHRNRSSRKMLATSGFAEQSAYDDPELGLWAVEVEAAADGDLQSETEE